MASDLFQLRLVELLGLGKLCLELLLHLLRELSPELGSDVLPQPVLRPLPLQLDVFVVPGTHLAHLSIVVPDPFLEHLLSIIELLAPLLFQFLLLCPKFCLLLYFIFALRAVQGTLVFVLQALFLSGPIRFRLCQFVLDAIELVAEISPHLLNCFIDSLLLLSLVLAHKVVLLFAELCLELVADLVQLLVCLLQPVLVQLALPLLVLFQPLYFPVFVFDLELQPLVVCLQL